VTAGHRLQSGPLGLVIGLFLSICEMAFAGQTNSLMDISTDGRLLACANRDNGTVTVVDLHTHQKRHELDVGQTPEGVTFVGRSHRLAVAVYAEDRIVVLDADSGVSAGSVDVFDEPYGIVSNSAGDHLFVTLDYPGRVVDINVDNLQVERQLDVGRFVRGIAISQDEKQLYTTEFLSSRVQSIDLQEWKVVEQWPGLSTDNLCRQIAVNPRRPKAYLGHIRSRTSVAQGDGSIFPYVTVVDLQSNEGTRRSRIPMDGFLGNLVTAHPWEVAVSPDGRQLYVVFSGTDDMFACEILDDDYREIRNRKYLRLGRNPRAVRVSPDNARVYVYNALDFHVVAYDAKQLEPVATIQVCRNKLSESVHRGKILFHSALEPMAGRRWIACSSCHPDGQPDGRTWQNPEGLRNTPSLRGLAWTHPLHWSADRDEVQDFEHTIRGPLMQGRGLIRGEVHAPLGQPNKGLSADLDALAAYTNSFSFTLSPHAEQGLSTLAEQGRALFFSETTGCADCHVGPFFTDSTPRPLVEIVRHDVGTGEDDPTETIGPSYDTPTLLGVYRTAPYLHDGRAATLKEVVSTYNRHDKHGVTSHLSETQLEALVAFLRSLPYEDPASASRERQLQKVQ
jgi:DNA-binding beta-propeller fold protein YncE